MERYDINEILAKVSIEDVVKRLGIETERRGPQTRALCPFHQDTRPSLNLYKADSASPAHFHCFACGAHGTAIDLVKQVQALEFIPAVNWLAQHFGLKPLRRQVKQRNERLVASETAMDFALRTFDAQHDTERFNRWCSEREFNEEFLYRQGLRCITHGVLVEALQSKSIGERAELVDGLERIGLIKRLRSKSPIEQGKLDFRDQFRDFFHDGRIVIPIGDGTAKNHKVAAFAGRSLVEVPPDGVPKYFLTSGFEKSNHLFNSSSAFKEVNSALKNNQPATLYLVEGFLDALRLQSLGQPAVALMGTSLSIPQLELLKALVENASGAGELTYSVFLDSDSAGFNGANRLVRRLLDLHGVDLRWVGLPSRSEPALGKDPDTNLRSLALPEQASAWLKRFELPAEGLLLATELGNEDASDLQVHRWNQLPATMRERALLRTALTVRRLYGHRSPEFISFRLHSSQLPWAQQLQTMLAGSDGATPPIQRSLYLDEALPRVALARRLAYHGSRRGELPCDEESWQTINGNEYLFDRTALDRLKATLQQQPWHQAAPFDAVHLPRKLTANKKVLEDPRRKVMPHPADLHAQQVFLNELLTQRHDRLSASGRAFSTEIPAVRWYGSRHEVVVTGPYEELNEPNLEWGEPRTLSFGYQIDMDVLEGDKTPSDQGMFRPFGQCWRDFMASLTHQCHAIGPRVHVLRLDARRYYDSIERYVVREELLKPVSAALRNHNPEGFGKMFDLAADSPNLDGALERLLTGLIFGHEYQDPDLDRTKRSEEVVGIPQGPVLSAYIGTIALFPVDDAARKFIRRTSSEDPEAEGKRRPRAGYARYVDDVVLFADSEALLKELREVLQAKAAERSIALIHKGESVRSGTPAQVMRQLNDGRGLVASVPAWAPPIVGDGEADWSLGDDLPKVDRQCALQMLRSPSLMDRPEEIANQVKAAMTAPDLRVNDLGLCARWLWWHVAAVHQPVDPGTAWTCFWSLWNNACEEYDWATAFAERGYDILFAVEGLDRLLDPNPWQTSGQFLTEVEKNRNYRIALARLICQSDFFSRARPATNCDHVIRRTRLVARKARRLAGDGPVLKVVAPQGNQELTAIEWLCLAGTVLMNASGDAPLAALEDREPAPQRELSLARAVIDQLRAKDTDAVATTDVGLAIDFVVRSVRPGERLRVLSKFKGLLSSIERDQKRLLIPHLPVLNHQTESLYEIDGDTGNDAKHLYRCFLRGVDETIPELFSQFVQAPLHANQPSAAKTTQVLFRVVKTDASTISRGKSRDPHAWHRFSASIATSPEAKTHFAARLFLALLAMHQLQVDDAGTKTYVPFWPQLFREGEGDQVTLYLLADPVPKNLLGVSAWYHDRDEKVQSENVPLAGADLWRMGWVVADVLGIASDMAGETGERDEQLDENEELDGEAHIKQVLEDYVLRQQLRKLQGSYLSGAQIDAINGTSSSLPGTVERALKLLRDFPAHKELGAQVRHTILVEAESRTMAMRMNARSSDDLRKVIHRVFPDALARLPLWALSELDLKHPLNQSSPLRPELSLMLSLYRALFPRSAATRTEALELSLCVALALAAVGVGLRGSVAALWGYAADLGSRRMAENLNLPPQWAAPEMARLDPQGDYRAMRKLLFDGNWPELCKASPWQWMLALIGLLDASFSQAFELQPLESLYKSLSAWQTKAASVDESDAGQEPWPYEVLPRFTPQQCEDLIQALPEAVCALDRARGMRVVRVQGRTFGRSRDTDEFTDATGAGWQMSKPQYTSLYTNAVEEHRQREGNRILKVWTETRRIADDDLLALHTLDTKLGKWLPSQQEAAEVAKAAAHDFLRPAQKDDLSIPKDDAANNPEVPTDSSPSRPPGDPSPAQINGSLPDEGSDVSEFFSAEGAEFAKAAPIPLNAQSDSTEPIHQTADDTSVQQSPHIETAGEECADNLSAGDSDDDTAIFSHLDRLGEWQSESWRKRLGGETSIDQDARISSHFRVALFQFRVDESYAHPLAEVGLQGLPLARSSQEALRSRLDDKSHLKTLSKAAQRHYEFLWQDEQRVISWPEHRRRKLLGQALKACRDLKVQLLVLPEVSVRQDTVEWLKEQLSRYPGLAVLAGTFRQFEANDDGNHLKEQLTLLWKPDRELEKALGLEGETEVIELQRGKKYRAVAAHELFRPDTKKLQPLYTEEKLVEALRVIRGRAKKGDWSSSQLIPLMQALIHGPQKLRYCMELICSELFMLTSPANRPPLEQELAKMLQLFGGEPSEATALVKEDFDAVGELLTTAQRQRERRSVLLVPAFTTRSNDYWHTGQASVLASGTATVFCNAGNKNGGVGGSCFIGIDSVSSVKREHTGAVHLLTPYHGWSKGILQPDCKGALSPADQALVVVDLDPVHVVSGKPRPQLLPEPMSLVAYLPVVEVIDKVRNAEGLADTLCGDLNAEGCELLREMLTNEDFPEACGPLHLRKDFAKAFKSLLDEKENNKLRTDTGGPKVEIFKEFFGDKGAVRDRLLAWLRDRHQQPAPKAGERHLEPAWLDFLVADLTWIHENNEPPNIRVPPWLG